MIGLDKEKLSEPLWQKPKRSGLKKKKVEPDFEQI